MKKRLFSLLRLFITLLLIFVTQKAVFMIVCCSHAAGAPFSQCLAALVHGLRLDAVMSCYLLIVPLLVLTVVSLLKKDIALRRLLIPYNILIAIVMAVVFVADVVMYLFWGAKIDAGDLMYATKPKDMLASVTWWSIILGIVVICLISWHYYRRLRHPVPEKIVPLRNRWSTFLFLPLAAMIFLGMRGGINQSTANPSYAYFSKYPFCNHAALNPLFNMMHSLFKAEDLENEFNYMGFDEAEKIVKQCYGDWLDVTDTLLTNQRPDILIMIWEGGCWNVVMNDSVGPNISSLADEGVIFTNCYANCFRTDRGVVSLLNGWLGLPTASLMKMSDKNRKLPSLASTLRKNGYSTSFVYGGDIDFTNMRGYLHETGFDEVVGEEGFPQSRRLSNWGAPDAYVLQTGKVLQGKQSESACFNVVLTLSSHEPWQVPMRRLENDRLNSFAYTDSCLGVFVDSLRHLPIWDNLLVVIVPDHGIPSQPGQSTDDPSVSHIPVVWVGGAVREHKEINVLMNQSDVAATLLAQMRLEAGEFIFSRNVLSAYYNDIPHFAQHVFKNGCNLIDSSGVVRLDCADGSVTTVSGNPSIDRSTFLKALIQYTYKVTGEL